MEVAGQALQTRRKREAGGLQVLGKGADQGRGAGLDGLGPHVLRLAWISY